MLHPSCKEGKAFGLGKGGKEVHRRIKREVPAKLVCGDFLGALSGVPSGYLCNGGNMAGAFSAFGTERLISKSFTIIPEG